MSIWDIVKGVGSYVVSEGEKNVERVNKEVARKNKEEAVRRLNRENEKAKNSPGMSYEEKKQSEERKRHYKEIINESNEYLKNGNSSRGSASSRAVKSGSQSPSSDGNETANRKRTTDREYAGKALPSNKKPKDFQIKEYIPLKEAITMANSEPGVYVLMLGNRKMKCGRAAYSLGVKWRLTQYYNLNYDARAQKGDYWSITPDNRDDVYVSWQCCPAKVCEELEYKLFKKYGKGQWALRAPQTCMTDDWQLLI